MLSDRQVLNSENLAFSFRGPTLPTDLWYWIFLGIG